MENDQEVLIGDYRAPRCPSTWFRTSARYANEADQVEDVAVLFIDRQAESGQREQRDARLTEAGRPIIHDTSTAGLY